MARKPETIEEAAREVIASLEGSQEAEFKALPEDELLVATHFGLSMWVRNEFGLWDDDSLLMKRLSQDSPNDYFITDPDTVSSKIIERAWQILNSET